MGMTITEKNMARHAGLDVVKPGQIIECHLDAKAAVNIISSSS